eukprot:scaffold1175_cov248-Pinguiococcus_pyrenoidosus.AAC.17
MPQQYPGRREVAPPLSAAHSRTSGSRASRCARSPACKRCSRSSSKMTPLEEIDMLSSPCRKEMRHTTSSNEWRMTSSQRSFSSKRGGALGRRYGHPQPMPIYRPHSR